MTLMTELSALGALAARSSWPDDYLTRNLAEFLASSTKRPVWRRSAIATMTDSNRIFVLSLAGAVGLGRALQKTTFGNLSRDEVLALRDQAKANLDAFIEASDADLAPLLHDALQTPIAAYEVLKAKAGRLDFLDLLIKARDLIRDSAAVRGELQRRISHFFVDEFQDTDPLQAEILLLLAADDPGQTDWRAVRPVPGKLFLVGDPKQSIYQFRRADVALYEEVKERLRHVGAEVLHLSTSFRSPPSIQSFVNLAFAPAMAADTEGSQAGYVPARVFKTGDHRTADFGRAAGSEAIWGLR